MVRSQDVDKGYAFAILPGCVVVYMLVIGGIKSYGLLFTELRIYFDATASNTGWSYGIKAFIITTMSPLANSLTKRFSFRKVVFIGGLLTGTGHILASIAPSMMYIYLAFGVISGIGEGLVLAPSITLVSYFFVKRRFIANGVVFASAGLWAAALSFLYEFLLRTYGLRGTLLLCGGIYSHICAAACIFVQPEELMQQEDNSQAPSENQTLIKRWIANEMKIYIKLLKQPSFLIFTTTIALLMFVNYGVYILMTAEVNYRGLSKIDESINVAIFGICDIIARLFFGWFCDKKLIHTRYLFILNMLMAAPFLLLSPFIKSLVFLRVFSGSAGLFVSSFMALFVPYLVESFGMETYPQAVGLTFLGISVACLISQPTVVQGMTADETGNWDVGFLLCGIILVVAALLLSSEPSISRFCSKKKTENKTDEGPTVWNTRL